MKRINTYTTALLLTVALTGCSREAEAPERPLIDGQIRISSQIEGDATGREIVQSIRETAQSSRAIAETGTALTGVQFLRKDATTPTAPDNYYGTPLLPANRLTSGEIVFTGTVPMYDKADTYTFFAAYWPAGAYSVDQAVWTIDGKTDILLSDQYNAGKLSAPNTGSEASTRMTFRHQLAQLEIVCKADPAATPAQVANTWGKITKIEITSTFPKMVLYYSDLTTKGYAENGYVSLALLKPDYQSDFAPIDIPANANTTANAVAMLVPSTSNVTGSKIPLRITTERQGVIEITTSLQNSAKFEKGKRHTVPLIFKWDGKIELGNSTIAEWNNGGTNLNNTPMAKGKPIIEYGIPPYDVIGNGSGTLPAATLKSYNYYTNDAANAANNGGYITTMTFAAAEAPYAKLEIATADEKNSSGATSLTWAQAWAACKNKTTGGSGWRLPRQSELVLMVLNKDKLSALSGFTALGTKYYSGTEHSDPYTHCIDGATMFTYTTKYNTYSARCVREVPLDPVIMEYNWAPYDIIKGEVYYADNRYTTTQYGYTTSSYNSYIRGSASAAQNGGSRNTLAECLNEVPYRKLEIERYDENPGTTNPYNTTWDTAWDACKNKKNGGGGWRLPRMSELMWMYHNRVALSSAPYFVGLVATDGYWSGTESSSSGGYMWRMNFSNAHIASESSSKEWRVRCVREVPIEPAIVEYGKAPNGNITSGSVGGFSYTFDGATAASYNGYTNDAADAANNGGYQDKSTYIKIEKPYAKFELAKEYEHDGKTMTWQEAWNLCKRKAPVGEWRLPRASEMVLVALNQSALLSLPYFESLVSNNWCGTEATYVPSGATEHYAFYYNGTSFTDPVIKTHLIKARCVRELK